MNFQINGRTDDILSQLDAKVQTEGEEQEKFKDRLRDFIDGVRQIYGNASIVNIFGDGQVDHGGASLGMQITIINYNDPSLNPQGGADEQTADK